MKRYIRSNEEFDTSEVSSSKITVSVELTQGQYDALKEGRFQFGSIGSRMIYKAVEKAVRESEEV